MSDPATEGSASNQVVEPTPTAAGDAANGHVPPAPSLMREAISLIKQHPLGAVATVAAATALIEVEFAVGILAGLGATALLAHEPGPVARQRMLEHGKRALERARTAMHAKAKSAPPVEGPPLA